MSNSTSKKNTVARWETRGKDYLELTRGEKSGTYWYRGNGCGGGFNASNDVDAVAIMEAGQVSVLKMDRPSVRRVLLCLASTAI